MNQLVDAKRAHFPAVLTYKKACDWSVITMLRERTLGNSSSALRNGILEVHTEEWLRRNLIYLNDCKAHRSFTGMYACIFKQHKICLGKDVCVLSSQYQNIRSHYHFPSSLMLGMPCECCICVI